MKIYASLPSIIQKSTIPSASFRIHPYNPIMFLTLPKSAPCSRSATPSSIEDTKSKSRRHSSIFDLAASLKSKKENRKSHGLKWKSTSSQPYAYAVDSASGIPIDAPPQYDTIYSKTMAPKISITTSEPSVSPSLHSPTRSRSRKPAHLRRPSQPWTQAPNAPKRTPTSETSEDLCPYSTFYPSPQANLNPHTSRTTPKVVVSGAPPREGPLCPYSSFYPSSQTDDMSLFSPFGSAPSGFYRRDGKSEGETNRRISTGGAWEKIGERRAREGARRWG